MIPINETNEQIVNRMADLLTPRPPKEPNHREAARLRAILWARVEANCKHFRYLREVAGWKQGSFAYWFDALAREAKTLRRDRDKGLRHSMLAHTWFEDAKTRAIKFMNRLTEECYV